MELSVDGLARELGEVLRSVGALPHSVELLWQAVPALCAGAALGLAAGAVALLLPVEFKCIWSQRTDLMTFLAPVVAAFAALPAYLWVENTAVPFWAYVPLVLVGDLMHIWATLLRTYLDTDARQQRSRLFYGAPPAMLALGFVLHAYSAVLHASFISYVAIYHFVSQNYGFLAIYKARAGERWNPIDFRLDYWTLMTAALGPVRTLISRDQTLAYLTSPRNFEHKTWWFTKPSSGQPTVTCCDTPRGDIDSGADLARHANAAFLLVRIRRGLPDPPARSISPL